MADRTIYQQLRDFADHLNPEPPLSPHIEISQGQILIMMSPSGTHDLVAAVITKQLNRQLPDDLVSYTTDIEHLQVGALRRPDVLVIAAEDMDTPDAIDATAIRLAVEIVAPSHPRNDYVGKLHDYPAMGVPHYVIVDPRDGTALHYWGIENDAYSNCGKYHFGEEIPVAEWIIDTGELPLYSKGNER
ncbi:Uma2 family endonuclease [Streptacidiphilus sp. EB129]|uniref:Uma2 family endonuclease n=1 Tax=Streptacidiphilus sp. EB129 TaxID=3156262 RepID=UPI003518CC3D